MITKYKSVQYKLCKVVEYVAILHEQHKIGYRKLAKIFRVGDRTMHRFLHSKEYQEVAEREFGMDKLAESYMIAELGYDPPDFRESQEESQE